MFLRHRNDFYDTWNQPEPDGVINRCIQSIMPVPQQFFSHYFGQISEWYWKTSRSTIILYKCGGQEIPAGSNRNDYDSQQNINVYTYHWPANEIQCPLCLQLTTLEWVLFQLEEYGPHPGHILCVARRLWVEVAVTADSLPLVPWEAYVPLLDKSFFRFPGDQKVIYVYSLSPCMHMIQDHW